MSDKAGSEAGAELGKRGAEKGGRARAESLTDDQRRELASQAAVARWYGQQADGPIQRATHIGTLKIADNELTCAVLEDGTRVLSRPTLLRAIGRTGQPKEGWRASSDKRVPVFLAAENLQPFLPASLTDVALPVVYHDENGRLAMGYKAELLPQVCQVFQDARDAGALHPAQERVADACKILYRGFATVGIVALVDEATGYQNVRAREALQAILDKFLRQEFAAWAKRFPDEFYEQMFRLKGWTWRSIKAKRPVLIGRYTKDIVYQRLAPGILEELERRNPVRDNGRRATKHHQWLTEELGHPALAQHIHALIVLMRSSSSWDDFKARLDLALPKRDDINQFELTLR